MGGGCIGFSNFSRVELLATFGSISHRMSLVLDPTLKGRDMLLWKRLYSILCFYNDGSQEHMLQLEKDS